MCLSVNDKKMASFFLNCCCFYLYPPVLYHVCQIMAGLAKWLNNANAKRGAVPAPPASAPAPAIKKKTGDVPKENQTPPVATVSKKPPSLQTKAPAVVVVMASAKEDKKEEDEAAKKDDEEEEDADDKDFIAPESDGEMMDHKDDDTDPEGDDIDDEEAAAQDKKMQTEEGQKSQQYIKILEDGFKQIPLKDLQPYLNDFVADTKKHDAIKKEIQEIFNSEEFKVDPSTWVDDNATNKIRNPAVRIVEAVVADVLVDVNPLPKEKSDYIVTETAALKTSESTSPQKKGTKRKPTTATLFDRVAPAPAKKPKPSSPSTTPPTMAAVATAPPPPTISATEVKVEYKKQLLKMIQCPVCLLAPSRAQLTACGHMFCEACIKSSVAEKCECPICRLVLKENNYTPIYAIQELINELADTPDIKFVPGDGRQQRRYVTDYTPQESNMVAMIDTHVGDWREMNRSRPNEIMEVPFGENWDQMPAVVDKWMREKKPADCKVLVEMGARGERSLVIKTC